MMVAPPVELKLPAVIEASGEQARKRAFEFFVAQIRNENTRRAYGRALSSFFAFMESGGIGCVQDIEPKHVAAYLEALNKHGASVPTQKQHMSAVRMLLDYLVTGGVMDFNPALSVRAPRQSTLKGKTPVLTAEEGGELLRSIPTDTVVGLRDRALIGLMTFTFARVSAACGLNVGDVFHQQRRVWVRLHEKGGKVHEMPCHHTLEVYLMEYIETGNLAGADGAPLFQSILELPKKQKRKKAADLDDKELETKAPETDEDESEPEDEEQSEPKAKKKKIVRKLSGKRLTRGKAWEMVQRRGKRSGIKTEICNHTFRGTGITAYLENGGTLEKARQMAAHASTRTTQLYDRRDDRVTLDEVVKINIRG